MSTKRLLAFVFAICLAPPLLQWCGFEFGTPSYVIDFDRVDVTTFRDSITAQREPALFVAQGVMVHSLLEWTAVCLAFLTAVLSAVHYFLKRDVTTPVIATALMFAALLDAFRVLAIDRFFGAVSDQEAFTIVTWAISRLFLVTLLVSGTLPFVIRRESKQRAARDLRDFLLLFVAYGLAAFLIIYYSGRLIVLGGAEAAESAEFSAAVELGRRLNLVALILFAVAGGIVFTLYSNRYRGLFATALVASLIPHVFAQFYASFGSDALFDNGNNLASIYKLIGYLVPVLGLILDYRRASQADAELATTERQLDIARDIQNSLLPTHAPEVDGIDVAGFSVASEAVGGDYFDYIKLSDGTLLAVIADVSGHDLGAALLMANARAYLKAWTEDVSDIAEVARSLNRFVAADARGRRFITAMLVRVAPEGDLRYICAGHTGYIVKADGSYRTLAQRNVPLGIFDEFQTDIETTPLPADETLVLLTDGVAELPNSDGEQFGLDRITRVVGDSTRQSAEETLAAVRSATTDWAGTIEPFDDMTLVILKRR